MSPGGRAGMFPWPAELYATALGGADRIPVFSRNPSVRLFREVLARHARDGMAVLDIGCGFAIGACHLAALGASDIAYTGIDVAPGVCERARVVLGGLPRSRVRGAVVCADARAPALPWTAAFDLALWNYSVHACLDGGDPSAGAALPERIAAALRPGGVLIVGDSFIGDDVPPEEVQRIRAYAARAASGLSTGVHRDPPQRDPRWIERLLGDTGFDLLQRRETAWFALGTYRGMPRARYALGVFAKPRSAAVSPRSAHR